MSRNRAAYVWRIAQANNDLNMVTTPTSYSKSVVYNGSIDNVINTQYTNVDNNPTLDCSAEINSALYIAKAQIDVMTYIKVAYKLRHAIFVLYK